MDENNGFIMNNCEGEGEMNDQKPMIINEGDYYYPKSQ